MEVVDRNSWCTPKALAELIGAVDLDPCSNDRSNIIATHRVALPNDGCNDKLAGNSTVVFLNPGYSRGQVLRWVEAYHHTRFIFLLRFDASTEWFRTLWPHCTHVWVPHKRINFEPPPGVTASSNPFPHALYMRDPSSDLLERLRPEGYLLIPQKGTK